MAIMRVKLPKDDTYTATAKEALMILSNHFGKVNKIQSRFGEQMDYNVSPEKNWVEMKWAELIRLIPFLIPIPLLLFVFAQRADGKTLNLFIATTPAISCIVAIISYFYWLNPKKRYGYMHGMYKKWNSVRKDLVKYIQHHPLVVLEKEENSIFSWIDKIANSIIKGVLKRQSLGLEKTSKMKTEMYRLNEIAGSLGYEIPWTNLFEKEKSNVSSV